MTKIYHMNQNPDAEQSEEWTPEELDEMKAQRKAYDFAKQNPGKTKIYLIKKYEHIKSNWWVWTCDFEDIDGNLHRGFIQSDGHMIADETLEPEYE